MTRAIFIVPPGSDPARFTAAAAAAGASEIAVGIPPALAGVVVPGDLPRLYVEGTAPDPVEPTTPTTPTPTPGPTLAERLAAAEEALDYLLARELDREMA